MKTRVKRWIDHDFHRYATNVLLLVLLISALAASFNWHDLAGP